MNAWMRRGTLLAVVLSGVLLSGCSSGSNAVGGRSTSPPTFRRTPGTPAPKTTSNSPSSTPGGIGPGDFTAIRELLAKRARAVVNGNLGAFMSTVDSGRPTFVQSQRVMFANLQALPVDAMSYDVGNSGLTNAPGITGGPLLSPEIVEHVFFRGTDQHPVGNEVNETFVRRDGQWFLGADSTNTDDTNGDTARPWAGPRIAVALDGPLIAVTDATSSISASALASTVASDLRFDAAVLDVPVRDHIVVDATSGGSVTKFDNQESAGAVTFPVYAMKDFRTAELAGYRIKVNPEDVPYLSQVPALLRHELTHYLLSQYSGRNPKWLTEGIAEYVSHQPAGLSSEYMTSEDYQRLMHRPHELTISGLFGQDPATDYPLAMACVTYLVDHGGVGRVEQLMKTFAAYPYEPFEDEHTRQALEKVYGFGPNTVAQGAFALLAQLH